MEKENKLVYGKEEAFNNLDRIIGFINNCDSKASVIIGIYGVVLTILISTSSIGIFYEILVDATSKPNFCDILFIAFILVAVSSFGIGIYKLLLVLLSKIDCNEYAQDELELESAIYFGDISKVTTYKKYKEKVLKYNEETLINDILSQTYINSKICTMKFRNYRIGFILSGIGFVLFLKLIFIGHVIY